jgi:polyhydroxybutyrate depolymerase
VKNRRIWLLFVCAFLGCGDASGKSDDSQQGARDAGGHDAGAPPEDAASAAPVSCTGKRHVDAASVITLTFAGAERTANVHLPPSYDPKVPMAVVLNFHGSSSNAQQEEAFTQLDNKADSAGFIAVHPDGLGGSWNAGTCCEPAVMNNTDDVGFVGALLDKLEQELCVDTHRIYATGMSNGAELSHRLACELADRIAAVSAVAGGNLMKTCKPSRPISVLEFHGDADDMVPIDGDAMHPSIAETTADWAKRDQCTGTPVRSFDKGDAYCDTHEKCAEDVEVSLCVVRGGGHNWPGGIDVGILGYVSKDLNANDAMWTFFQKHPLP